jgi:tetratricopeptide (TPR) repeat protein
MPYQKVIFILAAIVFVLAPCFIWAEKIELKNGNILERTVSELKDNKVYLKIGDAKEMREMGVSLNDIIPATVYRIRARFIDQEDAQAHWELGEYCLSNKLYDQAKEEFNKSCEIDEELKDKVTEKIDALVEEESQDLMNTALAFMRDTKYEDALKNLKLLLGKYPEGKYAEEATRVATFAAESLRKKIEEENKQKELEERKKEQERFTKEESILKGKYEEAAKIIAEVRELNAVGLTNETDFKIMLADKAYKKAIEKLAQAQEILVNIGNLTKDADTIKTTKEKLAEVSAWMVVVYNNLGQLWAGEVNFRESLKWLNKALIIDPMNKAASELKVKIIDIEARRKLLPKEYH